jgi:hypothetical protein
MKMSRPEKIYQAVCSCGYGGPPFTSRGAAEQDGDEHVIAMMNADDEQHRIEVVGGSPR